MVLVLKGSCFFWVIVVLVLHGVIMDLFFWVFSFFEGSGSSGFLFNWGSASSGILMVLVLHGVLRVLVL